MVPPHLPSATSPFHETKYTGKGEKDDSEAPTDPPKIRPTLPGETATISTTSAEQDKFDLARAVGALSAHFGANVEEMGADIDRFRDRSQAHGSPPAYSPESAAQATAACAKDNYTTAHRFQSAPSHNVPNSDEGSGFEMAELRAKLVSMATPEGAEALKRSGVLESEIVRPHLDAFLNDDGHGQPPTADLEALRSLASMIDERVRHIGGETAYSPYVSLVEEPSKLGDADDPQALEIMAKAREIHEYTIPKRMLHNAATIEAQLKQIAHMVSLRKDQPDLADVSDSLDLPELLEMLEIAREETETLFAGNDLARYHTNEQANPFASRQKKVPRVE